MGDRSARILRGFTRNRIQVRDLFGSIRIATLEMLIQLLRFQKFAQTMLQNFAKEIPNVMQQFANAWNILWEGFTKGILDFWGLLKHELNVMFNEIGFHIADLIQTVINFMPGLERFIKTAGVANFRNFVGEKHQQAQKDRAVYQINRSLSSDEDKRKMLKILVEYDDVVSKVDPEFLKHPFNKDLDQVIADHPKRIEKLEENLALHKRRLQSNPGSEANKRAFAEAEKLLNTTWDRFEKAVKQKEIQEYILAHKEFVESALKGNIDPTLLKLQATQNPNEAAMLKFMDAIMEGGENIRKAAENMELTWIQEVVKLLGRVGTNFS